MAQFEIDQIGKFAVCKTGGTVDMSDGTVQLTACNTAQGQHLPAAEPRPMLPGTTRTYLDAGAAQSRLCVKA